MVEQTSLQKHVAESKTASGRVWVPTLTQKDVQDKFQYWNKFKMTKNDFLFQEVVERFQKKAVDKRCNEIGVRHTVRSNSNDRRNRSISAVPCPYPSGSCNILLAGKRSTFCVQPILPPK